MREHVDVAFRNKTTQQTAPRYSPEMFHKVGLEDAAPTWDFPGLTPQGTLAVEPGERILLTLPTLGFKTRVFAGSEWALRYDYDGGFDNRFDGNGTTDITRAAQLVITTRRVAILRDLGADRWVVGHGRWDSMWSIWPPAEHEGFVFGSLLKFSREAKASVQRHTTVMTDGWPALEVSKFVAFVYLDYRCRQQEMLADPGLVNEARTKLATLDTDFAATGIRGMTATPLGKHFAPGNQALWGPPATHLTGPWPDNPTITAPDALRTYDGRPPRQSPVQIRGGAWMGFGPCPPGTPGDGLYPACDERGRDVAPEAADIGPLSAINFAELRPHGRWINEMDTYRGTITNRGHRVTIRLDGQKAERVKNAPIDGMAVGSLPLAIAADLTGAALKGAFNLRQRIFDARRNAGGPRLGHIRFDWLNLLLIGVEHPELIVQMTDQVTAPGSVSGEVAIFRFKFPATQMDEVRRFGRHLAATVATHRLQHLPPNTPDDDVAKLRTIADMTTEPSLKIWTAPNWDKVKVLDFPFPQAVGVNDQTLWGRPLVPPTAR